MANQKIVIQYVQYQEDWKEVFYGAFANVQQALQAVDNASFISAALSMRQAATAYAAVRVSDVNQPRNFLVKRYSGMTTGGTKVAGDTRNTAALFRLRTSSQNLTRPIFIRGLNETMTTRDANTGVDVPSADLIAYMTTYITLMNLQKLQVRALVPLTTADPYQYYDINQITVAAGGRVTLQTAGGTVPLGASSRVILSQFDPKLWPGINGHYKATAVSPPNFGISYISRNAAGVYPVAKGHYRVEEYRYDLIDLYEPGGLSYFVSLTSRATQSSPFGTRGARRATRLRFR